MPQGRLAQVLRDVLGERDERLLVGPDTLDDAGVLVLGQGEGLPAGTRIALVQTVDFFPPVVDDPAYYGAIAAANSLSDVYAMGGRPLSALSLAGFPEDFDEGWRDAILRAGYAKVREAGAVLAGGHTVEGDVMFGFAATGLVDPEKVVSNAGARPGDAIYLTKPLGMGCMTTAAKARKVSWEELEPAARQMATLNAAAAEAMNAAGVHACTDVTGYGLVGHAMNVARASGVTVRVRAREVPLFGDVIELARRKLFSGGAARGRKTLGPEVAIAPGIEDALVGLLFDAETSGGLMIFVPPDRKGALERELAARDLPVREIGEAVARGERPIEIV